MARWKYVNNDLTSHFCYTLVMVSNQVEPLAALDPLVVRPRDLRDRYVHPAKEVRRLTQAGVLLQLAHGHYAVIPERFRGSGWLPSMESVALGIAQRSRGRADTALMSVSAARVLGAVPRAVGHAVVATSKQRANVSTVLGEVVFVTRNLEMLDLQRADTELALGWVTTPEQTVLDLADRPRLTGLGRDDLAETIRWLARDADWPLVGQLADTQRKAPAALRGAYVAGVTPPLPPTHRGVADLGLPGAPEADPVDYGTG